MLGISRNALPHMIYIYIIYIYDICDIIRWYFYVHYVLLESQDLFVVSEPEENTASRGTCIVSEIFGWLSWLSWLSRLVISDSVLRSPMSWALQRSKNILYISILRFWFCLHRTFQIPLCTCLLCDSSRFPHLICQAISRLEAVDT